MGQMNTKAWSCLSIVRAGIMREVGRYNMGRKASRSKGLLLIREKALFDDWHEGRDHFSSSMTSSVMKEWMCSK